MAIPDHLMHALEAIAEREHRTPAEILAMLLQNYTSSTVEDTPPPGSLAALAKSAIEANIRTGVGDTARRSREILDAEIADDLKQRRSRSDVD